jgi:hypothetical protein
MSNFSTSTRPQYQNCSLSSHMSYAHALPTMGGMTADHWLCVVSTLAGIRVPSGCGGQPLAGGRVPSGRGGAPHIRATFPRDGIARIELATSCRPYVETTNVLYALWACAPSIAYMMPFL